MTDNASREIKYAVTQALALGIPDFSKPFFIYVSEKMNHFGSLDSMTRTRTMPSSILFKKLRWSGCWMAILPESSISYSCTNRGRNKVNFGTETEVLTPRQVRAILETKYYM